jgi:hypothetical protein
MYEQQYFNNTTSTVLVVLLSSSYVNLSNRLYVTVFDHTLFKENAMDANGIVNAAPPTPHLIGENNIK